MKEKIKFVFVKNDKQYLYLNQRIFIFFFLLFLVVLFFI